EYFVDGARVLGYGLVSGNSEGAVRMWDMRTGQGHRTSLGHSAQFSNIEI
ncbi:hypothetical protein B0H14DRAFT_2395661, partial [Mycena olivaceomarginata]